MLTGKDIYEATLFAKSDIAGAWDKLNTFDRQTYEIAASVLNGYHIAPLQGRIVNLIALVRDMQDTLVYCWDNEFPIEEVKELQQRAQQLLGEESKS